MQEKIVAFLKEKFSPVGIILHGSRATGKAKLHSDWDFRVFVYSSDLKSYSGVFEGQNIDAEVVLLPVADEEIVDQFNSSLMNCKIVLDTEEQIQDLVDRAQVIYSKGRNLTPEQLDFRKNFMTRCVGRLEDSVGDNGIFFLRLGRDFYGRSMDWWFMVLHNEFSRPAYTALEEISKKDPEYFGWLETISGNGTNQEKLEAARKIYHRLFG